MTTSKSINLPSVTVRVIVHLDDGRLLNETLELPEDTKLSDEVVFHIWEGTSGDQ